MSTHTLRPWTDIVKLHPDVESGGLTESVFAIDLGAIAAGDENVPEVYRNADAFFQATYLTTDLGKLLEEILASLDGQVGFNRVIKLRSPFGGGKSHTLAAILHATRTRKSLDEYPETNGFARPNNAAVAVFDGEKFDAQRGKSLHDGRTIRTMWGWLAWQIDPLKAYPIVEGHDNDCVAPGGDIIHELFTLGADGRPVLILLDEVLKYLERSAGVSVQDSTLQRQTKDFFQNLSVEVARSRNVAMVYSLIWSAREALDNATLLDEIDKLASRVDQLREPVTGEEVLEILKRRLLGQLPERAQSDSVAAAYSSVVSTMRSSQAETTSERSEAQKFGVQLRERINASYPFHPALIDIMRERWASVDAFQRTRGSLRFLASCMRSVKNTGKRRPLLGPGDIPLDDAEVRVKLLKELGAQNEYDPVILADLAGPNSRAGQIDNQLAKESPNLTDVKPATQVATAIFLYSFGGLRREGKGEANPLPFGVTETDLLATCVGPNLDSIIAKSVLSDLRQSCLYLHYDGVRYCFRTEQNVTKLIEDADCEVLREETESGGFGPVRERIKEIIIDTLKPQINAVVWAEHGKDIADGIPRFLIGYLPLEFSAESEGEQERVAIELLINCHTIPRRYRNGVGLAVPNKRQVEPLRRAVRRLLAIERILGRKATLRLSKEQVEQIKERMKSEEGTVNACLRDLYNEVWFPKVEAGNVAIEKTKLGGRPLRANGVHERVMEVIMNSDRVSVYNKISPQKIAQRVGLGSLGACVTNGCLGISVSEIIESFYRDISPPKLESSDVITLGIAEGIENGTFGYCDGSPALGADRKFQISSEKVWYKCPIEATEINPESGFLIDPSAIPRDTKFADETPLGMPDTPSSSPIDIEGSSENSNGTSNPADATGHIDRPTTRRRDNQSEDKRSNRHFYRRTFRANQKQVFASFQAVANLANKSDNEKVTITVSGTSKDGYDSVWLRNAVEEPFEEAGVEDDQDEMSGPEQTNG